MAMRRGLKVFDTLWASSLWSKWGFGDGMSFPDMKVSDKEYMDAMLGAHPDKVLYVLVKNHLVPEITRITGATPEIEMVGTHHNPVRAAAFNRRDDPMPEAWEDIEVEITLDDLRAAAKEVRDAPDDWLAV